MTELSTATVTCATRARNALDSVAMRASDVLIASAPDSTTRQQMHDLLHDVSTAALILDAIIRTQSAADTGEPT